MSFSSPGWEDPHFLTSGSWGTQLDGAERAAGGLEPLADSAWGFIVIDLKCRTTLEQQGLLFF